MTGEETVNHKEIYGEFLTTKLFFEENTKISQTINETGREIIVIKITNSASSGHPELPHSIGILEGTNNQRYHK